jgi:cytochrome c oxidase subunit 2
MFRHLTSILFGLVFWSPIDSFQVPVTPAAEAIINFHHDLMFYLLVVIGVVMWLLFRAVDYHFVTQKEKSSIKFFFSAANSGFSKWSRSSLFYHQVKLLNSAPHKINSELLNLVIVPSRKNYDIVLESILTILPTIILIFIAIPSFALLYSMDEVINPQYTLRVIGHQWYWSYEMVFSTKKECDTAVYLKKFDSNMKLLDDLKLGDLRLLEVNKKVYVPYRVTGRVLVTSEDVLHSWAIPSFGIKIDACPGRLNQVPLFPKRLGIYYGQCSEICGVNHGFMPIVVCVSNFQDFLNWFKRHYFYFNFKL